MTKIIFITGNKCRSIKHHFKVGDICYVRKDCAEDIWAQRCSDKLTQWVSCGDFRPLTKKEKFKFVLEYLL